MKNFDSIIQALEAEHVNSISLGYCLSPYLHIVYKNKSFMMTLHDKIGGNYYSIAIVREVHGRTTGRGIFQTNNLEIILKALNEA
jgi:hypothetical protein